MYSSISQRIKQLVRKEGRQVDFAKKTGINPATVSNIYAKEPSSVNSDTLVAIFQAYPKLNPRWLLLAEGKMWLTEKEQKEMVETNDPRVPEQLDKMLEEMNHLLKLRVAELEREIKRVDPDLAREIGIE